MSVDTILNVLFIINGLSRSIFFVQTESSVNINLLSGVHIMKLLIVAFVTLCLAGVRRHINYRPFPGKANLLILLGNAKWNLNFPDLKIKKTLLIISFVWRKKHCTTGENESYLKFGGIGGMLIGGLSLLALNAHYHWKQRLLMPTLSIRLQVCWTSDFR